MNKAQIAQEYALKLIDGERSLTDYQIRQISRDAWLLADAMEAEAKKREDTSLPEVLIKDFVK